MHINTIQFIILFGHIGPIQKIHINIDTSKNNQLICSREYIMPSRDHAVHINSTIISISFISKFGIDHIYDIMQIIFEYATLKWSRDGETPRTRWKFCVYNNSVKSYIIPQTRKMF